jgi:hypothetical protein
VRIPTRSAPTIAVLALALALAPSAVGCTGDATPTVVATDGTSPTVLPTVDQPVDFVPGEWTYENNGVTVAFSWDTGGLTVENGSGQELGEPGLYAVTQTQQRVDADVADAAPIDDGASVTLTVAFPGDLQLEDVGMVAIVFGEQNWGALSPVVADT